MFTDKDGGQWSEERACVSKRCDWCVCVLLFVESQDGMCRCARSRAFSRGRPTRTIGRSPSQQTAARALCGRSSWGLSRPTAVCSRAIYRMQCVVLSSTCGGSLAADASRGARPRALSGRTRPTSGSLTKARRRFGERPRARRRSCVWRVGRRRRWQ